MWIAASFPVFASILDPFRPVRVHVEEIQIVYIPHVAFGLGATTYSYDSRDNLTGASLPGGLSASYAYDNVKRLSSWSVAKAGSNLLARSCTRNGLGFKETESITAGLETLEGPASQTRAHNAANQITGIGQAMPSSTNLPFFDAAGNTTQVVLFVKGQTFTTRYAYDYDNKLTSIARLRNSPQGESVTTSVTQLDYDGLGLLLRITETGAVRRLVRDRVDQLARPLVETDASGNAVRWFIWANGRLLAQVQTNGAIRVAHCDELGRVLAFTDNAGALTDEYAYQPYGRLIAHSGATTTPFTFLGSFGVWDAGHGLYLTRHRAYDANLARFLQVDPIGLKGGWNLYAYGNGSPLVLIDPLGLAYDIIGINANGSAILGAERNWGDYDTQWGGRRSPLNSFFDPPTAGDVLASGIMLAPAAVYAVAEATPYVIAGGTAAIAAGENAYYRMLATQPGNVLNATILYYPQAAPARATTAELISRVAPYAAQFVSGLLPGPGGPYANKSEIASWVSGWGIGQIYEAANSPAQVAPAASAPRTTSTANFTPIVPK